MSEEQRKYIRQIDKRLLAAFRSKSEEEQENILRFLESDCGLFVGEQTGWGWFGFRKIEHLMGSMIRWVFKSTESPGFKDVMGNIEAKNKEMEQRYAEGKDRS